MASAGITPPIHKLDLGEDLPDDVFTIPDATNQNKYPPSTANKLIKTADSGTNPQQDAKAGSSQKEKSSQAPQMSLNLAQEDREAALRSELQTVHRINAVITGLINSLDRAKENMSVVSSTVDSASNLLNMWTRILSRTEQTQRLIFNPAWGGATADLAEAESELREAHREANRREEEKSRRDEERRVREEEAEERRRMAEAAGRGRGRARGRVRVGSTISSKGAVVGGRASGRGMPSNTRAAISQYGRVRPRASVRGAV